MLPPGYGTDLLPIPIAEQWKPPIWYNPVESSGDSIRYGNCYWPLPEYLLQPPEFQQSSFWSMENSKTPLKRARSPYPPASTVLPSKRLRFCPVPAAPALIKNVRPRSTLPKDIHRARSHQISPPTGLRREHLSSAVGMAAPTPLLFHCQIPLAASSPTQMAPSSITDEDEEAYHISLPQVSNTYQQHNSKPKAAIHTNQRHNSEPKTATNRVSNTDQGHNFESKAVTNQVESPTSSLWEDIERMCAELDFDMTYNDLFPPISFLWQDSERMCAELEFEVTYNDLFSITEAIDSSEKPVASVADSGR